jgi:hypothetical protein
MIYFYKSCNVCSPYTTVNVRCQHKHQNFAHTCSTWKIRTQKCLKNYQEERRKTYLEYVLPIYHVFLVLTGRFPKSRTPQKETTRRKIWTSRRPFCCSRQSSKTVVKPYTNRKRKIWWCSFLHTVQVFVIMALKNIWQHEIVTHLYRDIYFLHPLYYVRTIVSRKLWRGRRCEVLGYIRHI